MNWLISHWPLISAISFGVISEAVAIRQILKYPDNDGVGGILALILKLLKPAAEQPQSPPAA